MCHCSVDSACIVLVTVFYHLWCGLHFLNVYSSASVGVLSLLLLRAQPDISAVTVVLFLKFICGSIGVDCYFNFFPFSAVLNEVFLYDHWCPMFHQPRWFNFRWNPRCCYFDWHIVGAIVGTSLGTTCEPTATYGSWARNYVQRELTATYGVSLQLCTATYSYVQLRTATYSYIQLCTARELTAT